MGKFDGLTSNFIVSALMMIALFSAIVIVQNQNDAPQPLNNNSVFNSTFGTLTNQISNATDQSQEKYDVFIGEEPQAGFGSIVLFGIVSVGKTFSNIIFGFFGALIKLPLIVLGIPETIYSMILTWLIIVVIVAVWLLYKLGG